MVLPGEFLPEHGGVAGVGDAGFEIESAAANELRDFSVEVLHAFAFTCFHRVKERLAGFFSLLNTFASACIRFQNLDDCDPSTVVGFGYEALRNNVAERFRQTIADTHLFGHRIGVDDALDRLCGIDRIHRRKNQVPILGSFEQDLECFSFVHFPDQDHTRCLSQCGAQGERKVWSVAVHFALMNGGFFVVVQEFDGIFDGDDVVAIFAVDAIQKCCQGRGLAAAGASGHKNDAIADVSDIGDLAGVSKQQDPE